MFVAQRELGVGGESDAVGVDVTGGRASVGHLNVRGYVDVVHLWFPEARCCFWSRLGSRQECILDETRFWTGPGSGGGWILREAEFGKRLDSGRGWILEETGLEESGWILDETGLEEIGSSPRLDFVEEAGPGREAQRCQDRLIYTSRRVNSQHLTQVNSWHTTTSQLPRHHDKSTPGTSHQTNSPHEHIKHTRQTDTINPPVIQNQTLR